MLFQAVMKFLSRSKFSLLRKWSIGLCSSLYFLFVSYIQDEPFLFAEIEALNTTDHEYFINDQVQFSWKVKHGNGSYETAENVRVQYYFPRSVVNLFSSASWLGSGSKVETEGIGGSILTFTPAVNSLPKGMCAAYLIELFNSLKEKPW
jgi:hypothetical protein